MATSEVTTLKQTPVNEVVSMTSTSKAHQLNTTTTANQDFPYGPVQCGVPLDNCYQYIHSNTKAWLDACFWYMTDYGKRVQGCSVVCNSEDVERQNLCEKFCTGKFIQ